VKIIDPEFTAYAPPGLDAGSLLSGFVLAFLYRRLVSAEADALIAAMRQIWSSYAAGLQAEGLSPPELQRVEEDTVGFALIEVLRTSLGFAGARDPAKRIMGAVAGAGAAAVAQARQDLQRYQMAAVQVVRTCVKGRRGCGVGAVDFMLAELRAVDLTSFGQVPPSPSATEAMADSKKGQ